MKIFIYKSLVIFFLFIIAFKITFSYTQRAIERKVDFFTSKENIEILKENLRKEVSKAVGTESLINNEDKVLINAFIKKIQEELK